MKHIFGIMTLWTLAFAILFNYMVFNIVDSDDLRAKSRASKIRVRTQRKKD